MLTWVGALTVNGRFHDSFATVGSVVRADRESPQSVDVRYRNPLTKAEVIAHTRLRAGALSAAPGSELRIDVVRSDPLNIRPAGQSVKPLDDIVPFVVLGLVGSAFAFAYSSGRSRKLLAMSAAPGRPMVAAVTPPRIGPYPVMTLYADRTPGSKPSCHVLLARTEGIVVNGPPFNVEVVGRPRPLSTVVTRLHDGTVLLPAHICLAHTRARKPQNLHGLPARSDTAAGDDTTTSDSPAGPRPRSILRDLLLASAFAIAVAATLGTIGNARKADRIRERSFTVNAEVTARAGDRLQVTYEIGTRTYRSSTPIDQGSIYRTGVLYPAYVDPLDRRAIRMMKDPYDRTTPIVMTWLAPAFLGMLRARTVLLRRRTLKRTSHYEPRPMIATLEAGTPGTSVISLRSEADQRGTHRAIVMLPKFSRTDPTFGYDTETRVLVWGTLNPLDSPVVGAGELRFIPRRRLRASMPLRARLLRFRSAGPGNI